MAGQEEGRGRGEGEEEEAEEGGDVTDNGEGGSSSGSSSWEQSGGADQARPVCRYQATGWLQALVQDSSGCGP